jgi:protein farnesyltransferase subunit beta
MHRPADAYHTLYCLSGLAAAQHAVVPGAPRRAQLEAVWASSEHAHDALRKEVYLDALSWTTDTAREDVRGGAHNRLVRLSLLRGRGC